LPVKAFIQKEEASLFCFRGALLPEYQRALDELFVQAEYLVADITMAEHMPRTEALHLGMLVGVTHDLLRLQQRVTELEVINRGEWDHEYTNRVLSFRTVSNCHELLY
jgi:hypothetical protein